MNDAYSKTTREALDQLAMVKLERLPPPQQPFAYFDAIHRLLEGLRHATVCHLLAVNAGWWHDPATGEWKDRNDGEMIALMHSELSEALEGLRKDSMDDHLPHRKQVEMELADTLIRIFDFAGARKLDLAGAVIEKLAYNQQRADHKLENRAQEGGKKF